MKFSKLLNVLFYILPLAAIAQTEISAVATDASCTGDGRADGTIKITVKNVSEPIVYAVAKSPYDPANIIASTDSLITHLEPGDYFYGYYENNTFIKAATTIKVGSTYSSISPTIGLFTAKNYTYCASDPDPLGDIAINVEKGNPPYTVNLLNASDGTVVRNVQTTTGIVKLSGIPSGQYKVSATDNCGTLISPVTVLNLPPNEVLKNFNLDKGTINAVDLIYNTPNDVCSGISSATLPNGLLAVSNGDAYFNALPPFYGVPNFIYKLEIQNGSGWDVYDNLTLTDVKKKYAMPSDRSKWGIVRLSATYCNITKTVELDYGASTIGTVKPFTDFEFSIEDDPLNTNCNDTGQVLLKNVPKDQGGCLPYTVEVTDNSTGIKNTYTVTGINSLEICKLNIGKSYTIKVTDNTGIAIKTYTFTNNTSNTFSKKPVITDPKNVFIDPNYFAPDKDIKGKIQFFTGPSATFFGKCALAVYPPMATPGYVGLQGKVTVSLVNGPSPLAVTYKEPIFGLGNELLPGTYTIRIKDSACFDEEFQVVLDSYFTKIEITNVSFNPDASRCDRYNKNVTIKVSAVGTGAINSTLASFYGNNQIFPGIVSGPAGMGTFNAILGSNSLKEGISNFSFFQDIAGKYEIGIARKFIGGRPLLQSELIENTQTAFVDVQPNFPAFDLSKSGGIVCSGDTTGDLHTKVNNVSESITYFIKKETDSDFPTTGQSSPVFKGLTAGNYIVKAKTTCYEVLQPLILRSSFSQLINGGDRAVCIGGDIKLSIIQMGPINSIKWTLPDGTQIDAPELNINNVTAAQIGTYKVEINSFGGCYFTESINITLGGLPTPTGNSTQQFCAAAKATVADLITVETGIIWYDALTGGNIIPSSTLLIDGKTYYGVTKSGTCESTNRLTVTIIVKNDLPDKDPDWLTSVCISEKVTYTTVAGMSSYNWLVSNEGTIVNGGQQSDDFVTVLWNNAGKGAVEVNYIDETKCNPLVNINFSIEIKSCLKPNEDADIEIRKTVNNPMANIGQQVVFTISAENLGGNNFNNVQIRDILPSGYMYTSSKTSSGDYNITTGIWNLPELLAKQTETLTITAKVKATGDYLNIAFLENSTPEDHNPNNNKAQAGITNPEVIVFNMVSPNGDGKNDYFEIRGLERYPNNSVTIYNSWGVKVFETTNYGASNNFFRGISEGRATVNQKAGLPSGTYFYVLSYGNGALMTEKSGYLHLTSR